jgi:hypothetical protein
MLTIHGHMNRFFLAATLLLVASACPACAGATKDASDAGDDSGAPVDGGDTDAADAADAATCARGSIVFAMVASANADRYCIGGPSSCSTEWLSITTSRGGTLALDAPCATSCAGPCQPVGCSLLCAAPMHMPPSGVERTWDGTYHAPGTCGSNVSCVEDACARPGRYIATMCAYPNAASDAAAPFCRSGQPAACADVPFDWPPDGGSARVQGVVGASADAGACCPAGWSMYSCTYADGGVGSSCHNPALGCASSTTCGQGCDSVVTGRCEGG